MCGQVGLFGDITKKQENFFRELWQIDVLRGDDSSGVAFINAQNHVRVLRAIGTPSEVMYTKAFEKASRKNHLCIIGHNRFATCGEVTEEMAHPHFVGDIVGTHNGTLHNRHKLPNMNKFKSDSEQLFASINEQGLEKTWKNMDGSAAIVWWDRSTRTLNMLKNFERTLYFAYVGGDKEGSTLIWASEAWMIEALAKRRDIEIGTMWRPIVNTQYSFYFDKKKKIVKYSAKKIEKYAYIHKPYYQHDDYIWPNKGKVWDKDTSQWVDPKEKKLPFSLVNQESQNSDSLTYKNMTEEKFKEDYHICAYCEKDLGEAGYVTSIIIDTKLALCSDCATLQETYGMSS